MVLEQLAQAGQETKDNLGPRDSTKNQVLLRNKETILLEEGATVVETRLLGTAFILGHPSNGVLGTSQLGSGTLGNWTRELVVNPFNIWNEHFRDTEFEDTSAEVNLNWDTTNFRAEFVSGSRLQTNSIFFNNQNVDSVRVTFTENSLNVTTRIDKTNNPGGININLT